MDTLCGAMCMYLHVFASEIWNRKAMSVMVWHDYMLQTPVKWIMAVTPGSNSRAQIKGQRSCCPFLRSEVTLSSREQMDARHTDTHHSTIFFKLTCPTNWITLDYTYSRKHAHIFCPNSHIKFWAHTNTQKHRECADSRWLPNGLVAGRKCRAQWSVTVKAPERWLLTLTCREMDITQTYSHI